MAILSKFFGIFPKSLRETKSISCISTTAMLIALNIAIKLFTIPVTENLKISFSFLALAAIGMLYGPVVGAVAGFITDILGFFLVNRTGAAFDIRFTLVEVMAGFLYGLFLYGLKPGKIFFNPDGEKLPLSKRLKADGWFLTRVILGKSAVVVICNLLMTSYFIYVNLNKSETFWVYATGRVIKNLIQLPLDIVLLLIVLPIIYYAFAKSSIKISNSFKQDQPKTVKKKKGYVLVGSLSFLVIASLFTYSYKLNQDINKTNEKLSSMTEKVSQLESIIETNGLELPYEKDKK
ncbi:MAG: folate family ECF transporter S component [Clostridiales bacterium]|nr:folate family ECF transporter S component [Clostridiales bacterium]